MYKMGFKLACKNASLCHWGVLGCLFGRPAVVQTLTLRFSQALKRSSMSTLYPSIRLPLTIGILFGVVYVRSLKLCMMVTSIELYTFMSTLTHFQGHRRVWKNIKTVMTCILFDRLNGSLRVFPLLLFICSAVQSPLSCQLSTRLCAILKGHTILVQVYFQNAPEL